MVRREEIVKSGDGEMVGGEEERGEGEMKTKRMSPMEEKQGGRGEEKEE